MAGRCGCSGTGGCSCLVADSDTVTRTGNGSAGSPYQFHVVDGAGGGAGGPGLRFLYDFRGLPDAAPAGPFTSSGDGDMDPLGMGDVSAFFGLPGKITDGGLWIDTTTFTPGDPDAQAIFIASDGNVQQVGPALREDGRVRFFVWIGNMAWTGPAPTSPDASVVVLVNLITPDGQSQVSMLITAANLTSVATGSVIKTELRAQGPTLPGFGYSVDEHVIPGVGFPIGLWSIDLTFNADGFRYSVERNGVELMSGTDTAYTLADALDIGMTVPMLGLSANANTDPDGAPVQIEMPVRGYACTGGAPLVTMGAVQ